MAQRNFNLSPAPRKGYRALQRGNISKLALDAGNRGQGNEVQPNLHRQPPKGGMPLTGQTNGRGGDDN